MDRLNDFVSGLFLFRGIQPSKTDLLLKKIKPEIKSYLRTEKIYTPTDFYEKVGFVISGKCEVRRPDTPERHVTINTLNPGDPFGILAIFGERELFPTEIYATKNTSVLFIKKEDILTDVFFCSCIYFCRVVMWVYKLHIDQRLQSCDCIR